MQRVSGESYLETDRLRLATQHPFTAAFPCMKHFFASARILLGAGLPLLCAAPASAFGDAAPAIYVEGGRALYDSGRTDAWAVGAVLPWSWSGLGPINGWSFAWDLFASHWGAPSFEMAIAAMYSSARSPPCAIGSRAENPHGSREAGLGATAMNHHYRTPDRQFSTTFQFTEVLGLGRSFGARGEHELSLRLQHFSNASIKEPNPGANFARLRYLYRF